MSRKKKNRNQDRVLQTIILITAILNLAVALIELISKPSQ